MKSTMDNIKRCPLCNNKKISVVVDNPEYSLGLIDETDVHFKVICSTKSCGCGASSGWHNTKQKAIESWNRRADNERKRRD